MKTCLPKFIAAVAAIAASAAPATAQDGAQSPAPATAPTTAPTTAPATATPEATSPQADAPALAQAATTPDAKSSLDQTRLTMSKWIETQQIISKERNDWQQGREILLGRLELVKKEIAALEEKIKSSEAAVAESNAKRDALVAETDALKATAAQVGDSVGKMESQVRQLLRVLPQPLTEKLKPLSSRLPEDAAQARASVAERAQNVLGILNEANKANTEITVSFEVHNLSDGTPSEVQAIYVGLAQAYFVSAKGEAGVGRPGPDGWVWTPSNGVASRINRALEIIQGKHAPSFVPLPVKIQ